MKHNHEKNPHSFEKIKEENLKTTEIIEALTPQAAIRLKFFDDLINSAIKTGQIDEKTARAAKFTATASGRTATLQ